MRELTKSIGSFSWSMTLFGLQQLANLFTRPDPNRPRHKVTEALDAVTCATIEQFEDSLKETFKMGDKFQRSAMDMMFGMFTLRGMDPGRMASAMGGGTAPGGCCGQDGWQDGTGAQQASTGWGPMPAAAESSM